VLGATSIVLGLAAVGFPWVGTLAAELLFGGLLVAVGAAQIGQGLRARPWVGWGFGVGAGGVAAMLGAGLLVFPGLGALGLTYVFAVVFLAGGIARIGAAFREPPTPGRHLFLAGGLLSAALGASVLGLWPGPATWLLGLLLGVDLIANGALAIGAAKSLHRDS